MAGKGVESYSRKCKNAPRPIIFFFWINTPKIIIKKTNTYKTLSHRESRKL